MDDRRWTIHFHAQPIFNSPKWVTRLEGPVVGDLDAVEVVPAPQPGAVVVELDPAQANALISCVAAASLIEPLRPVEEDAADLLRAALHQQEER